MKEVYLVASGDLRLSANQTCWPTQADMEKRLTEAFEREDVTLERAHPVNEAKGHGFIDSQRMRGRGAYESARAVPTSRPTKIYPPTRAYGRRCKPLAAVRGAAASTTRRASRRF